MPGLRQEEPEVRVRRDVGLTRTNWLDALRSIGLHVAVEHAGKISHTGQGTNLLCQQVQPS